MLAHGEDALLTATAKPSAVFAILPLCIGRNIRLLKISQSVAPATAPTTTSSEQLQISRVRAGRCTTLAVLVMLGLVCIGQRRRSMRSS